MTLNKTGVIAGAFDVLHPGYIKMFKDAKENACDTLIILLHEDPSIERPDTKLKPILNVQERIEILLSLRFVDEVIPYKTEEELYTLNHYTNMRPLCSYTNRYIKRNKTQNESKT